VTVARVEDRWTVAERFNHPADFKRLSGLVTRLAELKIGQVMTLEEKQKAALKMALPGTAAEAGTLVELFDGANRRLAALLVGAEHMRKPQDEGGFYGGYGDGSYVSPDGGRSVYLVAQVVSDLETSPKDWLDRELFSVDSAAVSNVTATSATGETLELERPADGGSLKLKGLAENEELDSGKLYSIEAALSYLRADDVADPALSDEALGMTTAAVFRVTTKNGEVYTARIGGAVAGTGRRYARFEAALLPAPPAPEPPPVADTNAAAGATNALAEAKAKAEERKKTEEKIASLNAKLKAWTYAIESYKADAMTPTRSALVKPKEKKEEQPPPPPETAVTNAAPQAAVTNAPPEAAATNTPPAPAENTEPPAPTGGEKPAGAGS